MMEARCTGIGMLDEMCSSAELVTTRRRSGSLNTWGGARACGGPVDRLFRILETASVYAAP